jgi:hypothetical protein
MLTKVLGLLLNRFETKISKWYIKHNREREKGNYFDKSFKKDYSHEKI